MFTNRLSLQCTGGVFIVDLDDTRSKAHGGELADNIKLAILCYIGMIGDSPVDPVKPRIVLHKFLQRLINNTLDTIGFYSDLGSDLERSLVHGGCDESSIASLYNRFAKTPIFREFHNFQQTQDPLVLRYVLSFCFFLKKLEITRDDLISTALCDWRKLEHKLENLSLPDWVDNIRDVLRVLFSEGLNVNWVPSHGPGSVAEEFGFVKPNIELKNGVMTKIPPKIAYMYLSRKLGDVSDFGPESFWPEGVTPSNDALQYSRLIFVPKSYKSVRSINMEPVAYQYAQQGVRWWLEEWIGKGPLARYINLSDQGQNRAFAKQGSISRKLDTIDLSAASDSLSVALVRRIFPANVLVHLLATRSPMAKLPDEQEPRTVFKFAPMGSALCFPVQSITYTSVLLMVCLARNSGVRWQDRWSLSSSEIRRALGKLFSRGPSDERSDRLLPPSVFGDDIICDHRVTSSLTDALSELGFTVNLGKSFTGDAEYRESCGGFYYRGVDVTPYRLKLKVQKTWDKDHIALVASEIDACNRSFDYGFEHVRRVLIQHILHNDFDGIVKRKGLNQVLFTDFDDTASTCAIRTFSPRNSHLVVRRKKVNNVLTSVIRSVTPCIAESHDPYPRHDWYFYNQKMIKVRPSAEKSADFNTLFNTGSLVSNVTTAMMHYRDNPGYYDAKTYSIPGLPDEIRAGWRWTPNRA
jgi:hypothetical protein